MGIELYDKFRGLIKSGDLIEWRSNTAIGFAIRAVTKQRVNHTSGAIWLQPVEKSYNHKQSCAPRLYVKEAIGRGFVATYLSHEISKFKGEVWWSALKREYENKRVDIVEEANRLEGIPYDYSSLLRNLWKRVKLGTRTVYCSEAWQIALIRAGLLPHFFSPTGEVEDAGCGLRPGEFGATGLFKPPIRIF